MPEKSTEDESVNITADEIGGAFVPRASHRTLGVEVAGETVIVERDRYTVQILDPIGTIVWQVFDGTGTIDELANELSEAFDTDRETVFSDVLELTKTLGRAGLLEGVELEVPEHDHDRERQGLPLETEFLDMALTDMDGNDQLLSGFRGRKVLLVNWSPGCSFCVRLAPELAELDPQIREAGIDLVLVTTGSIDDNRELAEKAKLTAPLLFRKDPDAEDPFYGAGTPVAYLLDESGKVASHFAQGANQVPAIAREAAGIPEPEKKTEEVASDNKQDGPKFIAERPST